MERQTPIYRTDLLWLGLEINKVDKELLKYGSDPLKDNSVLTDSMMLRVALINLQKTIQEILDK